MRDRDSISCTKKKGCENAPYVSQLKRKFKVTHPFHPLYQKEFSLLHYRKSWGCQYVEYRGEKGEVGAIPLDWTDAGEQEPFVEISSGRSYFRVEELLRLVELVSGGRLQG